MPHSSGTIEHSEWGGYLSIMEYVNWRRDDEWLENAPADLIDEITIRISEQARYERQQNRKRSKP